MSRIQTDCIKVTCLRLFLFTLILFVKTSNAQSHHGFITLSGDISAAHWASLGIGSHLGYGFTLLLEPSETIRIGISSQYASPSITYDLIGAPQNESLRLSTYQFLMAFPFYRFVSSGVEFEATCSAGFTTLSSDPHTVSMGGLGSLQIPARSERSSIYTVGLMITKILGQHISVALSPKAVFISPVQMSTVGYSIEGGLSIGLF